MSKIIILSLPFLCLVAALLSLFFLIRNRKVGALRGEILNLCAKRNMRDIMSIKPDAWFKEYETLPSYEKMLYSFKPLRKEKWLSAEDLINLTTNNHV